VGTKEGGPPSEKFKIGDLDPKIVGQGGLLTHEQTPFVYARSVLPAFILPPFKSNLPPQDGLEKSCCIWPLLTNPALTVNLRLRRSFESFYADYQE
jgi:hypothetical protein